MKGWVDLSVMTGNRTRAAEFSVTSTIHYTMTPIIQKMANFKVNYKKFTTIRHNELRYVTENALKTVCKDVAVEPDLEPLTWTNNVSRADISMRGFRQRKQKVFLDVRVFNPLTRSYQNMSLSKMFSSIEKEKNRKYNKRIINIEHCTFTLLIFSANDGMSRETQTFYSRLAELLSEKLKIEKS